MTGDFESYGNVCANLSERTGYKVVSVNYRLAPEHRFPQGLEDCYEAMQAVLAHCEDWYQAKQEDIVIRSWRADAKKTGTDLSCSLWFIW